DLSTGRQQPQSRPGRPRLAGEVQTGILEVAVFLPGVAAPAASHDVFPGVGAAATSRHDVVDVLRLSAAVLALVPVANEDGAACNGHPRLMGNMHVVNEP